MKTGFSAPRNVYHPPQPSHIRPTGNWSQGPIPTRGIPTAASSSWARTTAPTPQAGNNWTRPQAPPPQASTYNNYNQTPATGPNTQPISSRPPTCVDCNDPTHGRDHCPVLTDHVQKGAVKILNGTICWPDGSRVMGRYGFLHEAASERLRSSGPGPGGDQSGTVKTNYMQFLFSEDDPPSMSTNVHTTDAAKHGLPAEADTRNTRPRFTRSGNTDGSAQSQIPTVRFDLPGAPTPNSQTPAQVTPSYYNPALGSTPPATSTPPLRVPGVTIEDEEGSDDDDDDSLKTLRPLKPFRRLRTSRIKRLTDPDEIAQTLLASQVTLPWQAVVGLSKDVQRHILEQLRGEKVPVPSTSEAVPWAPADAAKLASHLFQSLTQQLPNRSSSTSGIMEKLSHQTNHVSLVSEQPRPWYTRGLPMMTVFIGGKGYPALLDSASQINVMQRSVQEEHQLPLRYDGKHIVIGAGQQQTPLDGIIEFCEVRVGSVVANIHFFVQARCGYAVLLGMPALNSLCLSIDCSSGLATLVTRDKKLVQLQAVDTSDPAHTNTLNGSASGDTHSNALTFCCNQHKVKLIKSGTWTNKVTTHHVNTKRKLVADKILPTAAPSSSFVHQPLRPITYTRDPYSSPLTPTPPPFCPTEKLTIDRVESLHFGPKDFINIEERNLLLHVLKIRSDALAFDKQDKRYLSPEIADPYYINTIPHASWTDFTPSYPKADRSAAIALLQDQLRDGDLEYSQSPYVTSHFYVKKKDGSLRLIIDMRSANAYTIRDANIPHYLPDYVDGFVGRVCYGLGDLLSFFDQLRLHQDSRLLTAIRTPLGLLQKTGLPQRGTNSPAVAQRVSDHVGGDDVPDNIVPFVDDFGIKGPRFHYDQAVMPGTTIRRWVYEYATILERFLFRMETSHLVVSGAKFIVITDELDITGIKVSFKGKRADPSKLDKLQQWENPCSSQSSLRGFLGIANFLRPFIENFATIDAPLRLLVDKRWKWTEAASEAMIALKQAAQGHKYLGVIDYHADADIIL
ncbi:hypothetical protein CF326_g8022, partial [Tilletia indica]